MSFPKTCTTVTSTRIPSTQVLGIIMDLGEWKAASTGQFAIAETYLTGSLHIGASRAKHWVGGYTCKWINLSPVTIFLALSATPPGFSGLQSPQHVRWTKKAAPLQTGFDSAVGGKVLGEHGPGLV